MSSTYLIYIQKLYKILYFRSIWIFLITGFSFLTYGQSLKLSSNFAEGLVPVHNINNLKRIKVANFQEERNLDVGIQYEYKDIIVGAGLASMVSRTQRFRYLDEKNEINGHGLSTSSYSSLKNFYGEVLYQSLSLKRLQIAMGVGGKIIQKFPDSIASVGIGYFGEPRFSDTVTVISKAFFSNYFTIYPKIQLSYELSKFIDLKLALGVNFVNVNPVKYTFWSSIDDIKEEGVITTSNVFPFMSFGINVTLFEKSTRFY